MCCHQHVCSNVMDRELSRTFTTGAQKTYLQMWTEKIKTKNSSFIRQTCTDLLLLREADVDLNSCQQPDTDMSWREITDSPAGADVIYVFFCCLLSHIAYTFKFIFFWCRNKSHHPTCHVWEAVKLCKETGTEILPLLQVQTLFQGDSALDIIISLHLQTCEYCLDISSYT